MASPRRRAASMAIARFSLRLRWPVKSARRRGRSPASNCASSSSGAAETIRWSAMCSQLTMTAPPRGRRRTEKPTARLRLRPDIDPGVHVGRAAKVPDHGRAFELPNIPNAVAADVQVFIERHGQLFNAVFADVFHGVVGVLLAERQQQIGQNLVDQRALVARHVAHRQSRNRLAHPLERHSCRALLLAWIAQERHRSLLAVKGLKYLVRALGLVPVNILRM